MKEIRSSETLIHIYHTTRRHIQKGRNLNFYCFIIQGVSGGIVNILGGGNNGYSEEISSYKPLSSFQLVWRYSCLNVTHKKSYKRYEGKTNDLLIAFIGYVNDLSKLQQFKVSVQKSHHRLQCTFQLFWQ